MRQILGLFSAVFLLFSCLVGVRSGGQFTDEEFDEMAKKMSKGSAPKISVEELQRKLPSEIVLLDTRSREEYDVSHIAGARWVGYEAFDLGKVAGLSVDTTIVTYCSVGYRSERIAEQLQKAGFRHVYNLEGGIFGWVNKGNPVVDAAGRPVHKVHGYNAKWSKWLRGVEVVY
ncbi:MAG: hypothetical protein KatS3mg029_0147 [Saprospiraceae bacterium]|nr:MAG: hypothetical protein KatS3mg029_0147 [Saprospiraceae bacterium]